MTNNARQTLDLRFTVSGRVPPQDVERAREVFGRALAHAPEPVLHARVTLSVGPKAIPRPALASVRVDLNGRPVNAHAAAPTVYEAADRLRLRLDDPARLHAVDRDRHRST